MRRPLCTLASRWLLTSGWWLVPLVGFAGLAGASHQREFSGVVVDEARLTHLPPPAPPDACAMIGTVRNVTEQTLTVQVWYRGFDAGDLEVAFAVARVPRVAGGATRPFVSSSFFPSGVRDKVYPCRGLRRVETIEIAAEPVG